MKRTPLYIVLTLLVAALVIAIAYFSNKQKRYNWRLNYSPTSEQPYGTKLFAELLAESTPDDSFILNSSKLSRSLNTDSNFLYIAIGNQFLYTERDIDTLLQFVEKGGSACFITRSVNHHLSPHVFSTNKHDIELADSTSVYVESSPEEFANLSYVKRDTFESVYWSSFTPDMYRTDTTFFVKTLGKLGINDQPNFIKLKYGKGEIFYHLTPLAFTNYQLLDSTKLSYVNNVLHELPEKTIFFDYSANKFFMEHESRSNHNNSSQSPLSFLLAQRSMRWGWYTLLGALILYLLFNVKRKQRIIPIKDENVNTSLLYSKTIGDLYFNAAGHQPIGVKKSELFHFFVKKRYNISIRHDDKVSIKLLAHRSEVKEELIYDILELSRVVKTLSNFSDELLIKYHRKLEEFYQKAK